MDVKLKTFLRAAGLIRDALMQGRPSAANIFLPELRWAECLKILRQIRRASELGWHRATAQLRTQLLYQANYCRSSLQEISSALEGPRSHTVASNADIYRDLVALHADFDDVQCDFEADELSVTTPAITLEDIELGRFQIRLDWTRLEDAPAYRIVALDPSPAASNDAVTHPHVNGETLCEGEGRQAIRAALDEGRIADFFLLVWRLLSTYAPGRAYVELSDWCGSPCQDCGTHVNDGESCSCCRCKGLFCSECTSWCRVCDSVCCLGCMVQCSSCGKSVCAGCQEACDTCQAVLCPECINGQKCSDCCDAEEETIAEDETVPPSIDRADEAVSEPGFTDSAGSANGKG